MSTIKEAIELDRKIVDAISKSKGVMLSAKQLALLSTLGVLEILGSHRNDKLKEYAECLQHSNLSTSEEGSSSAGIKTKRAANSVPLTLPSSGMTKSADAFEVSQRALQMFR